MRRGRILIYLSLILILVLAAVWLLPRFLGGNTSPIVEETSPVPTAQTTMVEVVAVVQNLKRGDTISADVLQRIPISQSTVTGEMFTSVESLVGRKVRFDLVPGTLLTSEMLFELEELSTTGSDWALLIPRGMVAVSIPVDRLANVSYAPRRGDHVNVITSMMFVDLDIEYQSKLPNQTALIIAPGPMGEIGNSPNALTVYYGSEGGETPYGRIEVETQFGEDGLPFYVVPSEDQRPRLVSKTIIQNAMVLHVGNFPTEAEERAAAQSLEAAVVAAETTSETDTPAAGNPPQPTPTPIVAAAPPDVITLIVSPQDAVTLNYLIFSGAKLTLALRSAEDDTLADTQAVTLQYVLDQYGIPVPIKLPYGMEPAIRELVSPVLPNDVLAPTPEP
jgi:pilus assembly protein CpaB